MLVFFKAQIFKLMEIIIYICSYIESKYVLLKKYYNPDENYKKNFYYKNKKLYCMVEKKTDTEPLNYDKKIIINKYKKSSYSYIYVNGNTEIKNPVKNKHYFISIDLNINNKDDKVDYITTYSISLRNPSNFYFTNTPLLCFEHIHFLMKYYHNIEISEYTQYEISIMDNNFELKKINNEQHIEFNDDGSYEIKS